MPNHVFAYRQDPAEKKDASVYFVDLETVADPVSMATWTADPPDLTLSGDMISADGFTVSVFTEAPQPAQAYLVRVDVTTSLGRKLCATGIVGGQQKNIAY